MLNTKKNKIIKGISPLVAAVLLIAFTMAVGALITAWVTNITKGSQEKVEEGQKKIECSYTSIDIRSEFVRINTSYNGNVIWEGYIVNNGLNPITVDRIQLYDTTGKGSRIYKFTTPVNLKKDESKYIDVNITLPYNELGITSPDELDKIRLYTVCEGTTGLVSKPYGGWLPLDSPIGSIIDLSLS